MRYGTSVSGTSLCRSPPRLFGARSSPRREMHECTNPTVAPGRGRAIAYGADHQLPRYAAIPSAVIPAERALARESRNPVRRGGSLIRTSGDYWVPARARPAQPGSLGRDDSHRRLNEKGSMVLRGGSGSGWLNPTQSNV